MPQNDDARLADKVEDWPTADRKAWSAALEPGDILDDGGAASHLALASVKWLANRYGNWIGWLRRNGLLEMGAAPAAQVTPELVKRYIADLESTYSSMSIADSIQKLKLIAKILDPARDWSWLHNLWKSRQRRVRPARDKRPRMVDVKDLFDLGVELMDRAEEPTDDSLLVRALLYRDGLIIALLAACPMRLKNLTAIEIGRQIIKVGPNWQLNFDASETKGRRPYRPVLPSELSVRVDRYLSQHRPILFPLTRGASRPMMHSPAACRALWVSERGHAASTTTIYRRIIGHTRAKFGRSVNPHLFRDCVATTLAVRDPKRVRTGMRLLGHGRYDTTRRHYVRAGSVEACQRLHETVSKLRDLQQPGRDESHKDGGTSVARGRQRLKTVTTQ